jgi:ribonuclease P protein subunit RPR2
MAKKHKEKDIDQVPNPNNVSNRDIIQRLNFLYQASVYLNSVGPTSDDAKTDVTNSVKEEHKKKKRRRVVVSTTDLSRSYIKSMKIVGQKTTVKMYAPLYLCCLAAWTNWDLNPGTRV